jgi:(p)ppGpp synthase/HD superfamily hydrolase
MPPSALAGRGREGRRDFEAQIYVLTPDAAVSNYPEGSTAAVDFAYSGQLH